MRLPAAQQQRWEAGTQSARVPMLQAHGTASMLLQYFLEAEFETKDLHVCLSHAWATHGVLELNTYGN